MEHLLNDFKDHPNKHKSNQKLSNEQENYFLRYLPMEHLSNDHEDQPHQHENSHKPHDETGHPVLSLLESEWKLRQQHD